jgi:hypothetical protein
MVMRTFLAVIAACFAMLATFSVPWTVMLRMQTPRDDSSLFFEFLGTAGWLGIYLFPFSLLVAAVVVWPVEMLVPNLVTQAARRWTRITAWMAVALPVYAGIPAFANPRVALWALAFSPFAGAAAAFVFRWLARKPDASNHGAEDGNQRATAQ